MFTFAATHVQIAHPRGGFVRPPRLRNKPRVRYSIAHRVAVTKSATFLRGVSSSSFSFSSSSFLDTVRSDAGKREFRNRHSPITAIIGWNFFSRPKKKLHRVFTRSPITARCNGGNLTMRPPSARHVRMQIGHVQASRRTKGQARRCDDVTA